MKTVYFSHKKIEGYKDILYKPLKQLKKVSFILPHESSEISKSSKETIKNCDFFIAEVSEPSYGVGIETGWADSFNIPIIFIFKKGSNLANSLKIVSNTFLEYEKIEDILKDLDKIINKGP